MPKDAAHHRRSALQASKWQRAGRSLPGRREIGPTLSCHKAITSRRLWAQRSAQDQHAPGWFAVQDEVTTGEGVERQCGVARSLGSQAS